MAAQSPQEAANNFTSPPGSRQQPATLDSNHLVSNSDPPPSDAFVSRSNSTRRRKPSGQSPRSEITASDQLPSAPEPPKAPRGPPLSYRSPYEPGERYAEQGLPSSKSFAARAGILPEQFSPRKSQFAEADAEERSPVVGSRPISQRQSQDQPYEKAPAIDARRDNNRRSNRPQSYDARDIAVSPREPTYSSVNTGRAVYHQRPTSEQPRATNGESYAKQAISPRIEEKSPPVRSRSQRYSTQQQQQQASEKSPLQQLELQFNDYSKKEKRARVELAEQKLHERGVTSGRRVSQPDVPGRQSSTSKRTVSGPIYQRIADQATESGRRRSSQREVPSLQVDTGPAGQTTDSATPRSSRPISGSIGSTQPTPRRVSAGGDRNDDRGVRFDNQVQDIDVRPSQRAASGSASDKTLPKVRREDIDRGSGGKHASQALQPDTIPPQAVRSRNEPLKYNIPPQAAAAADARKTVGFGSGAVAGNQAQEKQHHHHLSDIFHRHPKETTNQAQPARGLNEWRTARIALLSLADMKTSSQAGRQTKDENYQAWWEEQQTGDRRKRNAELTRDVDQMDGYFDEQFGKGSSFRKTLHRRPVTFEATDSVPTSCFP